MSWKEEALYYILYLYVIENVHPETIIANTVCVSDIISNRFAQISTGAIRSQLYKLKSAIKYINGGYVRNHPSENMLNFVNMMFTADCQWDTDDDIAFLIDRLNINIDDYTV